MGLSWPLTGNGTATWANRSEIASPLATNAMPASTIDQDVGISACAPTTATSSETTQGPAGRLRNARQALDHDQRWIEKHSGIGKVTSQLLRLPR